MKRYHFSCVTIRLKSVESYRIQNCPPAAAENQVGNLAERNYRQAALSLPRLKLRGWDVDVGPSFNDIEREIAERAMAPEPPNLKGTVLMRDDRCPQVVDLAKLD